MLFTLFAYKPGRVFLLCRSDGNFIKKMTGPDRDRGDEAYEVIGDSPAGFLDLLAYLDRYTSELGYTDYIINVELS